MTERSRLPVLGLLLALIACQPVTSSPPATATAAASPAASTSLDPATVGASPSPSPTPLVTLAPGRPYGATDVLEAMRGSRRPGGVPDQLERDAIATAVASELWTIDGRAWEEMVAGGSCGPQLCTLEIAGTLPGALGEDLYVFEVRSATTEVAVQSAELLGLDAALVARLDAFARSHWPDAPLPGPLATARWLPPPDDGIFVLSYRSGGEEGSAAVDAVIDAAALTVELRTPGA